MSAMSKNLITMSLGRTYSPPPSPRGRGYKFKNFDQCLHIVMVIGKCTGVFGRIFWLEAGVEKRGICCGSFPSRNLSWGKKISMKGAQDLLALLKKKQ